MYLFACLAGFICGLACVLLSCLLACFLSSLLPCLLVSLIPCMLACLINCLCLCWFPFLRACSNSNAWRSRTWNKIAKHVCYCMLTSAKSDRGMSCINSVSSSHSFLLFNSNSMVSGKQNRGLKVLNVAEQEGITLSLHWCLSFLSGLPDCH